MIDFSQIGKFSWKYHFYNVYLRFNHNHVYYKEYRVINSENIPPKGTPTLVIANHQNGLTDALVLLYMYKIVVLTFPLMYLIAGSLAWIISGKFWFGILYLLAAYLSLIPFYAYRKSFVKLRALCRYRKMKKKNDPTLQKLISLKEEIQNSLRT